MQLLSNDLLADVPLAVLVVKAAELVEITVLLVARGTINGLIDRFKDNMALQLSILGLKLS
jgi:hypothetical protein